MNPQDASALLNDRDHVVSSEQENPLPPEKNRSDISKKPRKKVLVGAIASVVLIGLAGWWWQSRKYEETDDAQIDGHIFPISARVTGQVSAVHFEEGEFVKAGAVLAEIDAKDYEVAAEKARAEYEDALAEANAASLSVPVTRVASETQISNAEAALDRVQAEVSVALNRVEQERAQLADAHANARSVNADLERYEQLISKKEVSQQEYDRTAAAADAANARVAGAEAALTAAQQQVEQARARVREIDAELKNANISPKNVSAVAARAKAAEAKVHRAHTAMERAELDLQYTKVLAPVDGIVGKRTVQEGQNVQPGQDLLAIVPLRDIWITANFKEDQLALMHPGEEVSIAVDAYNRGWHGKVTSIGGATGARFSLLPPENATGNFVKVVQRIPVRIDLTGDANSDGLLRPGMSVVPKVRVR
jgi:membrane fusion protein (multidrug efflux system)